jgi:hypothetical protein
VKVYLLLLNIEAQYGLLRKEPGMIADANSLGSFEQGGVHDQGLAHNRRIAI